MQKLICELSSHTRHLFDSLQAQTTVKEAKRRFEKLKIDLGEKIDMVSASRCNLLSRSLPNYQKAVLEYSDVAAGGFHQLLVNLRAHHHHQYKVRKILEEIRDLEVEEMPFESSVAGDDEFSSLSLPEVPNGRQFPSENGDGDESLLDLGSGSGETVSSSGCNPVGGATSQGDKKSSQSSDLVKDLKKQQEWKQDHDEYRRVGDPFSFEEVAEQAKVNDLVLGGIEAELKALQNEVLQPRATDENPSLQEKESNGSSSGTFSGKQTESIHTSTADQEGEEDVKDLLLLRNNSEGIDGQSLTPSNDPSSSVATGLPGECQQDSLFSEWNDFSAFMTSTRGDTKSPLAGWEKEFTNNAPVSPLPDALAQDSAPLSSVDNTSSLTPAASVSSTSDPLLPSNHVDSSNAMLQDYSTSDVDVLLGLSGGSEIGEQEQVPSSSASEILSEELRALGLNLSSAQPVYNNSSSLYTHAQDSTSGSVSINPGFQMQGQQPPPPMQLATSTIYPGIGQQPMMFRSPLGTTQGPPVFPTQGAMGFVTTPPKFGLLPPGLQLSVPGAAGSFQPLVNRAGATGSQREVTGDDNKGDGKEKSGKGKSWMNFFAHLDPLVNEKA